MMIIKCMYQWASAEDLCIGCVAGCDQKGQKSIWWWWMGDPENKLHLSVVLCDSCLLSSVISFSYSLSSPAACWAESCAAFLCLLSPSYDRWDCRGSAVRDCQSWQLQFSGREFGGFDARHSSRLHPMRGALFPSLWMHFKGHREW